jgi:hypothetical protein
MRVVEVLPLVVDTGPMGGVDVPKLSPGAIADAIAAGLERKRGEIRVARIRQLAVIARLAPGLADRIVVRAFIPRSGA